VIAGNTPRQSRLSMSRQVLECEPQASGVVYNIHTVVARQPFDHGTTGRTVSVIAGIFPVIVC
jgi:hypothetical protein